MVSDDSTTQIGTFGLYGVLDFEYLGSFYSMFYPDVVDVADPLVNRVGSGKG